MPEKKATNNSDTNMLIRRIYIAPIYRK